MPLNLPRILLLFMLLILPAQAWSDPQPVASQSLDSVTLQLKWEHQFQFAGYIAAREKGFYAEAGLDVRLKPHHPGIGVIDEVVENRAEYGIGGIGILARYANGAPIKALAAVFQHDAMIFISRADSGIVSPYEIAGKKVMFDASTGNDAALLALLQDSGISLDDITVVRQDMGIDSLSSGRVDVLSVYLTDQPFQLRQQGIGINIINPHNYGFDFYGDLLFTSDHELQHHPGRAQRLLKASLKGWRYALGHPEEIIQLIKQRYNTELSTEQLRFEARETRKLILPDMVPLGTIEPDRLKRISDIYTQLGPAPRLDEKALRQFIHHQSTTLQLTEAEQAWLQNNPVIRVGVDNDFAPYESIDKNGEYVGLAADYIRLLENRLGVHFEIVHDQPWHQTMAMAFRGELDMLSCLNMTPERDEHLDFTAPYVNNPIVIVNANRNGYIGSLD